MTIFTVSSARGTVDVDADEYRTDKDGDLYFYDDEDGPDDPAVAFFPAGSYHGVWKSDDGHHNVIS